MNKLYATLILVASASVGAQQAPDLNKAVVKDGKSYTYKDGMPYIDRGQLKNAQPEVKRDPTPVEKAAQKVIDSPVRPALVNGQPGVEYHRSTK